MEENAAGVDALASRNVKLLLRRSLGSNALHEPAVLWISCTRQSEQYVTSGMDIRFTFLHTSDIHSRLVPYDMEPGRSDRDMGLLTENGPYGGVARLAGLIKREKANADRVLYLDSGDIFQGAPIFNVNRGEVEFRFLSHVGVDAMALGNHEFDTGVSNLNDQMARWVSFPILAANYIFSDWREPSNNTLGDQIVPFVTFNVKGIKVGVIGVGDVA